MPSPPLSVWPVVSGMSAAVMPMRSVPCASSIAVRASGSPSRQGRSTVVASACPPDWAFPADSSAGRIFRADSAVRAMAQSRLTMTITRRADMVRGMPSAHAHSNAAAPASAHADQGEVEEPRLRRDEALHPLAHGPRVEVVDDEEPGRIVDQPLMRGAVRRLDRGRVGRIRPASPAPRRTCRPSTARN